MSNAPGLSVVKTFNSYFENATTAGQVIAGFDLFSDILMDAIAGDDALMQMGLFNEAWAKKEANALQPYLDKFNSV